MVDDDSDVDLSDSATNAQLMSTGVDRTVSDLPQFPWVAAATAEVRYRPTLHTVVTDALAL